MKHKQNNLILERIYVGLLLVVFGGIVLQAPISVGLGSLFPHYELVIKAWAEILMTLASGIVLFLLAKNRQLNVLKDPLILLGLSFVALHLILLVLFWNGLSASIAGLIIDLRYVVFFGLVYVSMRLYPQYEKAFIKVGIAGATIVLLFAFLQVTILPKDILKYIGYSTHTIVAYLTVDQNQSFIRINSTLRGPNPVGAYALIVLSLILAALLRAVVLTRKKRIWIGVLAFGAVVALWASYSRSALLAAIIALLIIGVIASYNRMNRKTLSVGVAALIIIIVSIFIIGGSSFISNIVLHDNPEGGSATTSDEGHLSSVISGTKLLVRQPLGAGIGSTGSASLSTNAPLIIENQYLFIAHEVGWIGLLLFLALFVMILRGLWLKRKQWLPLGVFASGIGLAFIGLLLPVWVDDTVAIVWWGLAGIALGANHD